MKNTGITYSSTEKTPVVLPELAGLLPPLTGEQLSALEADILQNGCYSPIIVNEDLAIVDGHNRQALCVRHGIPYEMKVFHFDDMLEAMRWAVDTQKARRNLTAWELGKIALKLKPEVEDRAKANMSAGGGDQKSEEARQRNDTPIQGTQEQSGDPEEIERTEDEAGSGLTMLSNPISAVDTRKELADAVGIGQVTMGKVMQIDEKAPQAVKDALDNKEISVNKGYEITRQVQDLPEEEREQAAEIAVADQKMRKEIRKADAEIDRQAKIAGQFTKAIQKGFEVQPTEENIRCWVDCCRMRTREIKHAIDEVRELSEMYAAIEQTLRRLYPDAADALDEEDCQIAEEASGDSNEESGSEGGQEA